MFNAEKCEMIHLCRNNEEKLYRVQDQRDLGTDTKSDMTGIKCGKKSPGYEESRRLG